MHYYNGNQYDGQWRNDTLWGKGQFSFKNGIHYDGSFVNGLFEGQGTMLFVGIGVYKGYFAGGNLEGAGRFEYQDGSVYEGRYEAWLRQERALVAATHTKAQIQPTPETPQNTSSWLSWDPSPPRRAR